MRYRVWLLLSAAIMVLAACAPSPQLRNNAYLADMSIITGQPCSAPCWQNITPGLTTWGEAVDILSNSADLTNLDRDRFRETGEEVYNFNYQDGLQCCRIYTRDGAIVSSLLLLLKPEISISQVLERYGEPQFLNGEDATADQAFVSLVFPEVPMIVYVFGAGLAEGAIGPDSEVIGLVYLAPSEMELLLATEELYTWDDYGRLSEMLAGEAVIQVPSSG